MINITRYSGLEARLGNLSTLAGPYNIELVGDIEEFDVEATGESIDQPNLGNPYLKSLDIGRVRPSLRVRYHPQNTSFLHNYLIVQTGANLSAHIMAYYANSAEYGILFNAIPSNVEVSFAKNTPVTVEFTDFGTNWSTGLQTSKGNFSKAVSSTEPMISEQITSVRILDGATLLRDFTDQWRSGAFSIDYKTKYIHTGITNTPSDVLEGVRKVSGNIVVSVNESAKLTSYVTNASVLNIEIGFQNAPMSSCYTFHSSIIRTIRRTIPGIDYQVQRIEFESKYVTRSSL